MPKIAIKSVHPTFRVIDCRFITLTRNSCCHHARGWNRQYAINPMVARKMKRPWIGDAVPSHRTFYEICIIKWFVDIISPHNDMKQHFHSLLKQNFYSYIPLL